jgi:hypothetical protein
MTGIRQTKKHIHPLALGDEFGIMIARVRMYRHNQMFVGFDQHRDAIQDQKQYGTGKT